MYICWGNLSDFRENWKMFVFKFWENLRKWRQARGPPPQCHKSPPRARAPKKIFWRPQTALVAHRRRLDPPECFVGTACARGRD